MLSAHYACTDHGARVLLCAVHALSYQYLPMHCPCTAHALTQLPCVEQVPVFGFALLPMVAPQLSDNELFLGACLITACALATLGSIKARLHIRPRYMCMHMSHVHAHAHVHVHVHVHDMCMCMHMCMCMCM